MQEAEILPLIWYASSGYVAAMTDGDNIANATIDQTMVGRGKLTNIR